MMRGAWARGSWKIMHELFRPASIVVRHRPDSRQVLGGVVSVAGSCCRVHVRNKKVMGCLVSFVIVRCDLGPDELS